MDTADQQETHQTNSIMLKKMMSEPVTPDTFNQPHHELSTAVQNDLDCYYKNMNLNLQKMKLQLEPHP